MLFWMRYKELRTAVLVALVVAFIRSVSTGTWGLHSAMLPRRALSISLLRNNSDLGYLGSGHLAARSLRPETAACAFPAPYSYNANSSSGCVIFYPERFFHLSAVGAPFRSLYEHSKQVPTEHPVIHMTLTANRNGTESTAVMTNVSSTPTLPQSVTYFHIRKCGGTTMFRSFKTKHLQLYQSPYEATTYNRNMIQAKGIVEGIYKLQNQQQESLGIGNPSLPAGGTGGAVVFSFVRDPVLRFLSSVGQMLYMERIRLFRKCNRLRQLEREFRVREPNTTIAKSQALVHCILQSMIATIGTKFVTANDVTDPTEDEEIRENYNYIDQHFLPQAFELRARSLEYDIGIHLQPLSDMGTILRAFVGPERQHNHARASTRSYTQGYYLDPAILTTEMVHLICNYLYAVDVLLLHETGILSSTLCELSLVTVK